jgi:PleD family two-component response regulator
MSELLSETILRHEEGGSTGSLLTAGVLARADQAPYRGNSSGRNRVIG